MEVVECEYFKKKMTEVKLSHKSSKTDGIPILAECFKWVYSYDSYEADHPLDVRRLLKSSQRSRKSGKIDKSELGLNNIKIRHLCTRLVVLQFAECKIN